METAIVISGLSDVLTAYDVSQNDWQVQVKCHSMLSVKIHQQKTIDGE